MRRGRRSKAERARLARELHDEVGHYLTLLKFECAHLGALLQSGPAPPGAADRLQSAAGLLELAFSSVRRIASGLDSTGNARAGLGDALRSEAGLFQSLTGIPCRVEALTAVPMLRIQHVFELLQVTKEALTNVARHAGAAHVVVRLARRGGVFELSVLDDGSGVKPDRIEGADGSGLAGMRARVTALGGTLDITSQSSGGTKVTVRVPSLPARPPRRRKPSP